MRRFNPLLLPMLVFLLLLSSCDEAVRSSQGLTAASPGPALACPSSPTTTALPLDQGHVTLRVSGWTSTPAEDALVQASLKRFEQLHPSISVQWSPIMGDYPSKLRSDLQRTPPVDVFYLQPFMAPAYISSGKLLNLFPYMQRDHILASDYYPSLIAPFRCSSNQIYGIPKDWNTLGVFYNKQLFRQAKLPFPSPSWTWNDLRTTAKALTSPGDAAHQSVYGITLPANSSRWLAFLFSNGGSVLSPDGTHATFNDDAAATSLAYYTSFQLEDGSSALPSSIVPAWDGDTLDAFVQQRAAMVVEGGWLIPYIAANAPNLRYGIAPLPLAPNGKRSDLIFTNSWSAASQSQHPAAAWEMIKFMTGSSVQEQVMQAGFALPSLIKSAQTAQIAQNPDLRVLFDAATTGYPDQFGLQDKLIHDRLNLAITNVLLHNVSPQAALDDAARQVNRALSP